MFSIAFVVAVPVSARAATCVVAPSLYASDSVLVRPTSRVGENVTLTVQVAPDASIAPQVPPPNAALFVQPKPPPSVPPSAIRVAATAPQLVTVNVCSWALPTTPEWYGGSVGARGGAVVVRRLVGAVRRR